MKSLAQTLLFAAAVFLLIPGLCGWAMHASLAPGAPFDYGLLAIIAAVWHGLFVLQWAFEFRKWNHGLCRANGAPWEFHYSYGFNDRVFKAGDKELNLNNWFIAA